MPSPAQRSRPLLLEPVFLSTIHASPLQPSCHAPSNLAKAYNPFNLKGLTAQSDNTYCPHKTAQNEYQVSTFNPQELSPPLSLGNSRIHQSGNEVYSGNTVYRPGALPDNSVLPDNTSTCPTILRVARQFITPLPSRKPVRSLAHRWIERPRRYCDTRFCKGPR